MAIDLHLGKHGENYQISAMVPYGTEELEAVDFTPSPQLDVVGSQLKGVLRAEPFNEFVVWAEQNLATEKAQIEQILAGN